MKFRTTIIGSDLPTHEQIAKRLKHRLYDGDMYYDEVPDAEPRAISITYEEFCKKICERERIAKHLYSHIEFEGGEIGIIVGFGWYGVVVATDRKYYMRWQS